MKKNLSKSLSAVNAKGRHRYVYRIGVMSLQWNTLEDALEKIIATYFLMMGVNEKLPYYLTGRMGNQARCDLLLWLVEHYERDKRIGALVEHAVKSFDICRLNRNELMHSRAHRLVDTKRYEFTRRSKTNPLNQIIYSITLPQARALHKSVFQTEKLFRGIEHYVWVSHVRKHSDIRRAVKQPSFPKKSALPNRLKILHPVDHQERTRPQPPSRK